MTTTARGTFTEEVVEAAGIQVQLRKGGRGDPLLVLPSELGVPGWLSVHHELAGHFTVYVPSLPGFGQSARPDWIVTVRDLAAWVTWFVRDMGLTQPLNVIGFSMGGWVAAEIATMNSSVFKKMVEVAPEMPDEAVDVDYMMENMWIVGDPQECADQIRQLYEEVGGVGSLLAISQDRDAADQSSRYLQLQIEEVGPKIEDLTGE